mgnify:CR=1 FL=1
MSKKSVELLEEVEALIVDDSLIFRKTFRTFSFDDEGCLIGCGDSREEIES